MMIFHGRERKQKKLRRRVREEIRQVKATSLHCYRYGFFSRSGFRCEAAEDRILIGLEELYQCK